MTSSSPSSSSRQPRPAAEVLSASALRDLGERIKASGVLGRSPHYRSLLDYLIDCAVEGQMPKEVELAVNGLGRDADYDASVDSSVRVYVHQLRKKLDTYFEQIEPTASPRLVIPRGQYRLAAIDRQASPPAPVRGGRAPLTLQTGLLAGILVLLAANLIVMLLPGRDSTVSQIEAAASHPVWQNVLDDEQPILLVMGDYYIFGELNANGNIARMVREFNVNSSSDLEELRFSDIEAAESYLDLDLSYMPEGSAFALARVVPILQESGKPVTITMMSDLSSADIRSNHIVYIGYISALDKLREMAFAGSGLAIGRSYDELLNKDSLEYYTSDAGLPEEGEPFKDYALFTTFPASSSTQAVLISGMRDAGLMHMAQALSDSSVLNEMVASIDYDTDEAVSAFETLFEVYGVDRLNFDASLVYSRQLDARRIWRSPPEINVN